MKKIITFFIIALVVGCSNNDEQNSDDNIDYLNVNIDKYNYYFNEGFISNLTFDNVVLQLSNSKVVKRIGSPIAASTASGGNSYGFTANIYDTIYKENNKITIFKKIIPFNGATAITPDKKEFFLKNDGKIDYKINYNQEYTDTDNDTIYFEYLQKRIIKTYSKNYGNKTKESVLFYNNNQNLDSIVTKFYVYDYQSSQMILSPTREVETFEQYDSANNPFKSLTIFDDMFKRSLSKNNFSNHRITQYNPLYLKYQKSLTLHHDSMGNLIYKN